VNPTKIAQGKEKKDPSEGKIAEAINEKRMTHFSL